MQGKHDSRTDKETTKIRGSGAHIPEKSFKGANVVGTRLPNGGQPKGMKKTSKY